MVRVTRKTIMKRFKRRLDYGTAGNEILSIGPMPEYCAGQNGWIELPVEVKIPRYILSIVNKEGFVILTRQAS